MGVWIIRGDIDVTLCWIPWLAWILGGWEGRQLAIAADATSLGCRFVLLAVRIVYRGCAVPVAWKDLKAQEKHTWKPARGFSILLSAPGPGELRRIGPRGMAGALHYVRASEYPSPMDGDTVSSGAELHRSRGIRVADRLRVCNNPMLKS